MGQWLKANSLNPWQIQIDSNDGYTNNRWIADKDLAYSWRAFHKLKARLEVVDAVENLKRPKIPVDWDQFR